MSDQDFKLIHNTLKEYNSILIPIPEVDGLETLGSAIALASLLKSEGKNVEILSSYFNFQKIFNVIDNSMITSVIQNSVESVITIDTTQYPIDSIKYDKTESQLRIYLNSTSNKFNSELVSIQPGQYPYDLIITLDTRNWTQLGSIFLNYPHIFLDTPSIAISSFNIPHPYSERTIVRENYTNSAEIIFEYIDKYSKHSLSDKNIVNSLLLSLIISDSDTLSSNKKILKLRELTNDYDSIVNSLNSIIKDKHRLLIGRILAHLEFIKFEYKGQSVRYAYSKLFPHDFTKTNTNDQDIFLIYREILKYLPTNILGLNIFFDAGKNIKKGYLNFPKIDITPLYSSLEGEYKEGLLIYNYSSEQDIHITGKEINEKIVSTLKS